MKKTIAMISFLLIAGCAGATLKDTNKIVYGLARQQVVGYLGEPEGIEKSGDKEFLHFRLTEHRWSKEKYDYYVELINKKVVNFGHHIAE